MKIKAQTGLEFMMLIGVAYVLVIVFVSASNDDIKNLYLRKEFLLVKDTALIVQNEIDIASNVETGYVRNFTIPNKISGKDYNITIINNVITIWTDKVNYIVSVPNVVGNVNIGNNTLTKVGQDVYLNQ